MVSGSRKTKRKVLSLSIIDDFINFDNNVLTLEKLSDQEIISLLINQLKEPDKDDNSEIEDFSDEDLLIISVFNAVKILSNYLYTALSNISPETNFEKLEKKIQYDFYTSKNYKLK